MVPRFYKDIFIRAIFCALLLAAGSTAILAQTSTFTYQGRLTDNSVSPTASYDMEFRLFDAPGVGGGTQIGTTETRLAVPVSNGIFTVQLNFGDEDIYDTTRLYLEIRVKPAGAGGGYTTLAPRQQITSAPTAVQARNAETAETADNALALGGTAAADFVRTTDARLTDARTPTSGSNFYIQNNSTATPQTTSAFNITGSGRVGGTLTAFNAVVQNELDVQSDVTSQGIFSGNGSGLTALNASNIASGTLNATRVPDLSAAKITSGTFTSGLIPSLDASKITTGAFADARLSSNIPRLNQVNIFTGANFFTGTQTTFNNVNGVVAFGTPGSGAIPLSGTGGRMMWYGGKTAFRAGRVTGAEWNDANVGDSSAAFNFNTIASGDYATAFGYDTDATGSFSFAAGDQTLASGAGATAFGAGTTASGFRSLATGTNSIASGSTSTAMGNSSIASGDFSTALGFQASTNNQYGSFVISDASSTGIVKAVAPNQFVVGAAKIWLGQGNAVTYTAGRYIETSTGAYLSTSGVWTDNSSRFLKTNFSAVDARSVLRKVLSLPIQTWSYKTDSPDVRHIGVMAQDFYRAFNVGADDEHLTAIDTAGVSMAAIQGLNEQLKDELETRDKIIAAQQRQLAALAERLTRLERKMPGKPRRRTK